jgi:hypothetical protein
MTVGVKSGIADPMGKRANEDCYSDQETVRRTEAALRAAFSAPHKPQSEMKLGKPKATQRRAAKPLKRRRGA